MKILYVLGHSPATIAATLINEFQDIEVNPITIQTVQQVLEEKKTEFLEAKNEFAVELKKEGLVHLKEIIRVVADSENRMVVGAAAKLDNLVDAMLSLDLTVCDSEGNLKNLPQYLRLLEAMERTQKIVGRLSGTDAARELTIYLEKSNIDQQGKGSGGLIPKDITPGRRPKVD